TKIETEVWENAVMSLNICEVTHVFDERKNKGVKQWSLAIWAQDSIKEGVCTDGEGCLHSHLKQRPTMAEVVVGLESVLALQEKANSTLQRAGGMTIFRRKVPLIVSPSNAENLDKGVDWSVLHRCSDGLRKHCNFITGSRMR
ncbi:hypothetical protein Tco_1263357, partial [Tanacetum coccineum]